MSRREELLRQAAEAEKNWRKAHPPDKPYNPGSMESERMPLGCWIWIIMAMISVFFIFHQWLGL